MRPSKLFVIAAALSCTVIATSASAVTTTTFNLFYERAKTPISGYGVESSFGNNDKLMVQIVMSSATLAANLSVGTGSNTYSRFRDASGTIKVFNNNATGQPNSGEFITLSDKGVEIRVYDDEIRFGTRGGGSVPDGQFYLHLKSGRNTVTVPEGTTLGSGTTFNDMIAFLASDGDKNGGKMRVRTNDENATSGAVNVFQSKTTLDDVEVSQVVSTVPLPAGAWLLLGGVGIMALRRKRAA